MKNFFKCSLNQIAYEIPLNCRIKFHLNQFHFCRRYFIPNYTAHTRTNCLLGLPLVYLGLYKQSWVNSDFVAITTISFFLSTLLFSPDLDLKHSIPTKNWGILSIIWIGYPRIFRHRGKSHSILFSSLTKLIYLSCVLFLCLLLFVIMSNLWTAKSIYPAIASSQKTIFRSIQKGFFQLKSNQDNVIAALLGLIISDLIHIFTDKVYSALKKLI